jgi:hypothetical protein
MKRSKPALRTTAPRTQTVRFYCRVCGKDFRVTKAEADQEITCPRCHCTTVARVLTKRQIARTQGSMLVCPRYG